jgi:hypothetical protein
MWAAELGGAVAAAFEESAPRHHCLLQVEIGEHRQLWNVSLEWRMDQVPVQMASCPGLPMRAET